jgi:hypothetical protein
MAGLPLGWVALGWVALGWVALLAQPGWVRGSCCSG